MMEVSKEARMQTARAAKSVAAAREATMELDKVLHFALVSISLISCADFIYKGLKISPRSLNITAPPLPRSLFLLLG